MSEPGRAVGMGKCGGGSAAHGATRVQHVRTVRSGARRGADARARTARTFAAITPKTGFDLSRMPGALRRRMPRENMKA
jgi:hypothetical protein